MTVTWRDRGIGLRDPQTERELRDLSREMFIGSARHAMTLATRALRARDELIERQREQITLLEVENRELRSELEDANFDLEERCGP